MATIERIVIKKESGFCHIDDFYKDRLDITRNSIKYVCRFHDSENRPPICWSFKTTNRHFQELFDKLSDAVLDVLDKEYAEMVYDVGPLTFSLSCSDKTKQSITVFKTLNGFDEVYSALKEMVPTTEYLFTKMM